MSSLLQLALPFALVWVFAYHRAHMYTILASLLVALLLMSYFDSIPWMPWVVLLTVGFFYIASGIRRQQITLPLYRFFQRVLPPINRTESEALEAGDIWWEAELFQGDPDWKELLHYPQPQLTPEEQSFVDNETETLCGMLNDWKIVQHDKDLTPEAWQYLKDAGFLGMIIPQEFGGLGFSAFAHSCVVTKIATKSSSAAVSIMVPNSLGPAELLLKYGTDEQRQRYLPGLATGKEIPCFGLTSPEAGSDAGSIIDRGIVCKGKYEGKDCLGLSLTWNKRYITLAPVATVLGLAFKMYDPEHLLGGEEELGITVALVPTDHPGVILGHRHYPMGMAFMNGPTQGKDVFIPLDWIIGGVEYAGKGWQMLVECLSEGRAISLPALATATAKMSYRLTGAYARLRRQFNLSIGNFEGIEEALSRIAGYTYQLEAARIMTAGAVDLHIKPSVVSAIAKYHMTENSRKVIQDAMDVHGGRGLILGARNYLAYAYISTPIAITVEGANILTRNLIIFGQGAIRCHPFILREMQAAKNSDAKAGLAEFDSLIFRHIGYTISNFVRTLTLSLTWALLHRAPVQDKTSRYYRQLTRMSSSLALVSDISMMLLGGALKRKERLSARLGDVLSNLYLGCAVLKYYRDNGSKAEDLPYVDWNLQLALYNCQQAFQEFFENLPNRPIAWLLRLTVFPFGRPYSLPEDRLEHELVQSMFSDNELRNRITSLFYVGKDDSDPAFVIEDAFLKVLATKETRILIRQAVKDGAIEDSADPQTLGDAAVAADLCTRKEIQLFVEAEIARSKAIQVDDYPPQFFAKI
ncbi:MAG: acyl-CoA dehydrogenase [Pseudohongiella sp.]|nr:acyl-CoA dehydrogenase [Pseudohongiella sp.]